MDVPKFDRLAQYALLHPVQFAAIGVAVSLVAYYAVYLPFFHPLAHIPGPFLGRFSELWKLQHMLQADFSDALSQLHSKYGRLVRLAPNEVSILDANEISTIYGHGTKFRKSKTWYGSWSFEGAQGNFDLQDPVAHGNRRRAIAHVYSINNLLTLEPFVNTVTEQLIAQFDKMADGKTPFDLAWWLHCYAFDVVGELAIGSGFGLVENGRDDMNVLKTLRFSVVYPTVAGQLTALQPITSNPKVEALISRLTGFTTSGPGFNDWVREIFDRRLSANSTDEHVRMDMFEMFRRSKDVTTGQLISRDRLLHEVFDVIGAGSDTTAVSLRAFLFHTIQHPEAYARVQAEIDEIFDSGVVDEFITYAQASKLTYFQACLKEAMRLQPAVTMHIPREVPTGGALLSGQFFKAGSIVGISPKLVHRTTEAYGKDATEFRPERWLDQDDKGLIRNNLTFGQGARVCIGKNISLMEMSKVLPTLVRKYEFEFVNKEKPWTNIMQWFEVQEDWYVTAKRRDLAY